jgi:transcriptional regulator GlxA family with amidase domain
MVRRVGSHDVEPADPAMTVRRARERLVVLVGYPGVQTLDLVGPAEVFAAANFRRDAGATPYRIVVASPRGGTIASGSGLRIADTVPLASLRGRIDTLVLAGGPGVQQAAAAGEVPAWVRRRRGSVRRVCSVCTGAFLLGAAGLLAGRRVATHWGACDALASAFPDAIVERDAIFVVDPPVYSSAGVTAAIDLCLALVEEDLGRRTALAVARELVLYLRRPGGQSQFSESLAAQEAASDALRDLLAWVQEHPASDLRVERLAKRAGMSPRHFARVFRAETSVTPAVFVEGVRAERAKLLLEETDWSLAGVAARAGFGSEDSLARSFRRRLGVTPREYRTRFSRPRSRRS